MTAVAFLRAIQDHPHEDGPRLVYADRLDEQGDADRAEFIRVQCALARLDEDDDRRAELERRETELWRDHGRAWSKPLRTFAREFTFRRGFADHVALPVRTFLDRADALFALMPTWSVAVRAAKYHGAELAASPALGRLTALNLGGNRFGTAYAQSLLAALPYGRLEELDLSNNALGPGGAAALAGVAGRARLRALNLDRNRLGDRGLAALAGSAVLDGCRKLHLADNDLGPAGLAALAMSPHAAAVTDLNLSAPPTSKQRAGDALATLPEGPGLAQLTRLDLSHSGLTDAGLAALAGAARWAGLADLGLCANWGLTDAGFQALAQSPHLRLERLDLSHLRIAVAQAGYSWSPTAAGLTALVRSPVVRSLRRLDLSINWIGTPGVEILADAPALGRLTRLNLASCDLTDAAVTALAASPHLTRLRHLDLSGNDITDAAALALARAPALDRLSRLCLRGRLGDPVGAGRQALRGRFGDILVEE
jgi:uncharacterized protein (TIGR02996 family)